MNGVVELNLCLCLRLKVYLQKDNKSICILVLHTRSEASGPKDIVLNIEINMDGLLFKIEYIFHMCGYVKKKSSDKTFLFNCTSHKLRLLFVQSQVMAAVISLAEINFIYQNVQ